jgi:hypothetical protein
MVNNTWIIYESIECSQATFKWCWRVHDLDTGMVCPYPGLWGSTDAFEYTFSKIPAIVNSDSRRCNQNEG